MGYKIENIISDRGFSIKLLHYSEATIEQLDLSILTVEEKNAFALFKSVKRQLEFYYTRLLWKEFGISQTISYNSHGRPFIQNFHLSISHSRDIIVIGLNERNNVGIDVEYYSQKIAAIRHKFISVEDERLIETINDINLTLVWSIKEAVYKMEDIPGLSLKENIHVKISNNVGSVNVIKGNEIHHYSFSFMTRKSYVITYCTFDNFKFKLPS